MRKLKSNKIFALFCVLLIITSCNDQSVQFKIEESKREVMKTPFSDRFMEKIGDTVIFVFESGFNEDKVTVFANGESMGMKELTTEESTGLANAWYLPPVGDIKSVGLSLDNSKVNFELLKGCKYVFANKNENEVMIEFSDRMPLYE